ncbi:dimethylhistidine N-methyltransferase [Sphingobium wenxiniae]|uniref:Dimethylhistidine N-methyltransferase n=1 Tax=Sphingobium wenxiniae (strain DSM 21828 / CGMCC 1.7748 / JZ-1) TaxID=595605 RepID=A0A562KEB2_SPHWJ|nr:L-histidine N(alpha)-methyltransferase [Sphingobium wenxiniae]MBB6190944.1 dimethylhistidine N-methyltransferase [Sphingobium wenxiniae]TWH93750.1 dimethylhistidine N-methyltransferase [Sphingobium wenxiniae]
MTELMADVASDFGEAVISGLSQPRRIIPARYLYDVRGSELFEQITRLPEYYPTRTETLLLKRHAADLGRLSGRGRPVVEFGAGSAAKTPLLLDATGATTYVPIDISKEFLEGAMARLAVARPALRIVPIAGDFTHPLKLPPLAGPLTGFFPGSTIGNFDHRSAVNLLRSLRQTLGPAASLVIGIDSRKNSRLLEAAYDDAAGITAAFNLNLLHRINRELDGTIPIDAFEHRAVWHDGLGRVEMHLVANRDVAFAAAGRRFSMGAGETIHTENSYKYTLEEARLLARASGWEPLAFWTDPDGLFGLHVWTAASDELQP